VNAPFGCLRTSLLLAAAVCGACGNPVNRTAKDPAAAAAEAPADEPMMIKPPFAVQGELEGLLLVWFDAEGVHTAQKRSEVPEAQRANVRVDSLNVAPDARLDADHVYVADLRSPDGSGTYPVRRATRGWFDAQVDRAKPQPAAEEAGVTIYMASWCGACRAAASYLRARKVPFVEKDVEKDAGASAEMQRKAQEKGLSPRGVPVIDFRGEILLGFDQARLERLVDRYAKAI
jgi:glutaredoxin